MGQSLGKMPNQNERMQAMKKSKLIGQCSWVARKEWIGTSGLEECWFAKCDTEAEQLENCDKIRALIAKVKPRELHEFRTIFYLQWQKVGRSIKNVEVAAFPFHVEAATEVGAA